MRHYGSAHVAPSGIPDEIVSRLDRAIGEALQDDTVRKHMNDIGFGPLFLDQAAFVEQESAVEFLALRTDHPADWHRQ